MKNWNKNEIDVAKEMISSGASYKDIGITLNKSAKAVKVKLNKLGLGVNLFKEEKFCKKCGEKLKCDQYYFCSRSCSASFNNKGVDRHNKTNVLSHESVSRIPRLPRLKPNCLNCGNITTGYGRKYCCRNCQQDFKRKERFLAIENGDMNLGQSQYKKFLIHKYGEKCMECGWCQKNPVTNKIPIELEHVDGNSENNSLDNLKLLCPNCHSLTPTYKALNVGNGRHKRRKRYQDGKSY